LRTGQQLQLHTPVLALRLLVMLQLEACDAALLQPAHALCMVLQGGCLVAARAAAARQLAVCPAAGTVQAEQQRPQVMLSWSVAGLGLSSLLTAQKHPIMKPLQHCLAEMGKPFCHGCAEYVIGM